MFQKESCTKGLSSPPLPDKEEEEKEEEEQ